VPESISSKYLRPPTMAGMMTSSGKRAGRRIAGMGGEMHTEKEERVLLRPGEVGRMLGVSAKTVDRWADAGMIGHVVTLGGHRRFRAEDVDNVARRMQVPRPREGAQEPGPGGE
jgi:excisionase family DNA binding protein